MSIRFLPIVLLFVLVSLEGDLVIAQTGGEAVEAETTPAVSEVPAPSVPVGQSPPETGQGENFSPVIVQPAVPPRSDALLSYRTGRDLEAASRMTEAEGYYNEAVRICSEEITGNRGTRDSYTVLTWTLQRQRKYADVIAWGERGLRVFTDDYRIIETMGEAYFYLGSYDSSLRFMQRYVNALPQGERASTAYFFIGEIFRLQQKFFRADIAYTTAVKLEPGIALWWFRLGSVREAMGDYAPAQDAYQRALGLNTAYQEARTGFERVRQFTNSP